MTKAKKSSTKTKTESSETGIDLHPDAWDRFEKAVDKVVKAKPMHRAREKQKKG